MPRSLGSLNLSKSPKRKLGQSKLPLPFFVCVYIQKGVFLFLFCLFFLVCLKQISTSILLRSLFPAGLVLCICNLSKQTLFYCKNINPSVSMCTPLFYKLVIDACPAARGLLQRTCLVELKQPYAENL